jgi:S1-C subfamily serine protease
VLGSTGGGGIDSIEPDSPAPSAGLGPGDVITAIDGRTISSIQQFIERSPPTIPLRRSH